MQQEATEPALLQTGDFSTAGGRSLLQTKERTLPVDGAAERIENPKADLEREAKTVKTQAARFKKLATEIAQQEEAEQAEAKDRVHSSIWDRLQHPHHKATSLLETGSVPSDMKALNAEAARDEIAHILDKVHKQAAGFEKVAADAEKAKAAARAAMSKLPKSEHDFEDAKQDHHKRDRDAEHLRTH